MPSLSIRAYARHRAELGLPGTTHKAVQKAVAAGRILLSADGKIDPDEADRRWAANTDEGHRRNLAQEGRTAPAPRPPPPAEAPTPPARTEPPPVPRRPPPPEDDSVGGRSDPPDYAESRARREAAEAALSELELAEKKAELIPAKDLEARLVGVFAGCKTKLLGIPSRARQQDPTLGADQIALVESLIREALEDLAAEGEE